MELLKKSTITAFDTEAIKKGDLIRAKYKTWPEPRNGIVTAVSEQRITVLYLPGLHNVSNYFPITAEEAAAGLWSLLWSSDLVDINQQDAEQGGAGETA